VVVKAQVRGSAQRVVAIKKIKRVFEHTAFAHRAMRELRILRCLGPHDNIINIRDIILPSDPKEFNELYVVTDYLESDLHDVIRVNDEITRVHKQFFMYQLLKGLKYIHSAGVIHRDIKPQNLLVNKECELKICDFGLATVQTVKINKNYDLTNYVVTRWFRAPELLLKYNQSSYTSKIDMWSVGCVFAEMYMKRVIFGEKDLAKQIQRFVALLGLPSEELLSKIPDQSITSFLKD
jgi:serine/threonine protein kinase